MIGLVSQQIFLADLCTLLQDVIQEGVYQYQLDVHAHLAMPSRVVTHLVLIFMHCKLCLEIMK